MNTFFYKIWNLAIFVSVVFAISSCTERIDESSRYVYNNKTIADYLSSHEEYSEYFRLLGEVPVSIVSQTTPRQLLGARGNYTVFAPTNDAIQVYLDTLCSKGIISEPNWNGFQKVETLDSIRKVIVMNSIIDGGDVLQYQTNQFPTTQDAEIPLSNMMNNKMTVHYGQDNPEDISVCGCPIDAKNRDILLHNGVIHRMNAVVSPGVNTLGIFLHRQLNSVADGFHVTAMLIDAVGLLDTLSLINDEAYEKLYLENKVPDYTAAAGYGYDTDAYAPEHRKYGFTLFAETDEFWCKTLGKTVEEITIGDVVAYLENAGFYPNAKVDANYTSVDNLLNLFVTYHLITARLTPDRLLYHYNEKGYDPKTQTLGVAMAEYYVSMGKRRLLKIYESAESNGVYLNRFAKLDNGRHGTYHELYCDPDKEGVLVGQTNREGENDLSNALVYPIERALVFDESVRQNMGSERIRWDFCAIWTEMTNNDIRCSEIMDGKHQMCALPSDPVYRYLDDVWMDKSTYFYYSVGRGNGGWHNYEGDETRVHGQLDMLMRLPPVPRSGVYELRYSVTSGSSLRSIVQFYWGDNRDKLAPTGIPMDLRIGGREKRTSNGTFPSSMGWESDTDDDDYNAEVDKRLRTNGYMKGPNQYVAGLPGGSTMARADEYSSRRIVLRAQMDADKTYYIRCKQVVDDPTLQFYMDYMEFCPKDVYDNPYEPEDIW